MATEYTQQNARCLVFTFKDGVLSKLGHNLKLEVTQFKMSVDSGAVSAEFDPRSLKVISAVNDGGQEDPSALSDGDKRKIESQIIEEVLHPDQHPKITFASTSVSGAAVKGNLSLHGVTKSIDAQSRSEGGRQVCDITLQQPDFGIAPYKAMMGALKVRPDVTVRLEWPR